MQLPIFFQEEISSASSFALGYDTSKHVIQVLRMKAGEQIQLTNGKGHLLTAEIIDADKRSTEIKVVSRIDTPPPGKKISIAISILKNANRFEWFVEKATELGVAEIIPLICNRTERQQFRQDRIRNIMISAMLQSRQAWMPVLDQPVKLAELFVASSYQNKFIAHCDEGNKLQLSQQPKSFSTLILIGPEGDFTKEEIQSAIENKFLPVSLGETRLRTETAGIVAATLLCMP